MKPRRHRSLGQSLVEFTLVGIPIVFVLISIFEISRGMQDAFAVESHARALAAREKLAEI